MMLPWYLHLLMLSRVTAGSLRFGESRPHNIFVYVWVITDDHKSGLSVSWGHGGKQTLRWRPAVPQPTMNRTPDRNWRQRRIGLGQIDACLQEGNKLKKSQSSDSSISTTTLTSLQISEAMESLWGRHLNWEEQLLRSSLPSFITNLLKTMKILTLRGLT